MPAATTTLFYGSSPFPALQVSRAEEAARLIESGDTVVVPDADTAALTLVLLGLTVDEARAQMLRCNPDLA